MNKRDTSAASAARFLALRARDPDPNDPRRPDPAHMTLQQFLVGTEYRYRDVTTGREYTALEAR